MKIEFEKTFGEGVDPWYAKAERWIKKKFRNPFLQHLALGFLEWLRQKWIDVKIANTMREIDAQAEDIKKIWEEENKYKIWLDIEIAAAQAMEKLKIIPKIGNSE